MSVITPTEITRDNDLTFRLGPIRGVDPADGVFKDWIVTQLSGWITQVDSSDTPLGGVTITVNSIGNATFVPFFDAAQVNMILTAAGALVEGATLWAVFKGTGDLRIVRQLIYRTARRI
jgi:hypothetical protein